MASIKQIAKELGVSAATVSNALSGKGRVSTQMAVRIQSRAAEIGYQPSTAARALKTGRSNILGLVMPDLTNPLFPKLVRSIEGAADAVGCGVLIADSRGNKAGQDAAIRRLVQRGVDGIVAVPHRGTRLGSVPVPTAIINTPSDPGNTVCSDHIQGGRMAAQAMLDLGHRDFLLIGSDPDSEVQQDRIAGMMQALPGSVRREIIWTQVGAPDIPALVAHGFTVALTTSDMIALRVLGDAQQGGVSVPGQLSIVGFDDLPLGTAIRPALSTMMPDFTEIATRALAVLTAKIAKLAVPPISGAVEMIFIARASSGLAPVDRDNHQQGDTK